MKYINLFILVFSFKVYALEPHSLDWPLTISTDLIWLGDSLSQYVGNDEHGYLHGGCDLIVPAGTGIVTPVAGLVDVHFYKVQHGKSGHVSFFRKPFMNTPELLHQYALTTEVRITTPSGFQILFHHVDPQSIPVDLLEKSKLKVPIVQGSLLGQVIQWPMTKLGYDYSHVHYAILSPSGKELNCQYYSIPLPDQKAPQILKVLAVNSSGELREIKPNQDLIKPTQLIVVVEDQTDFSPFAQPPARVGIIVGKNVFEWDFRERLAVKGNINSVLVTDLYFLNEKSNHNLATVSDYWTTRHSIKLEVPIGSGAFTIFAEDTYGHRTTFTGTFK